ncbi:hypothetical protein Tco_0708768 [Tanacetum coccineum]
MKTTNDMRKISILEEGENRVSLFHMQVQLVHFVCKYIFFATGGNGVLIVADIQEVIGSTLAIKIWTNGVVPIRAGVLITAGLIVSGFIATLCGNYVDYGGISAAPPPPPPPPTKEKAPKSPKE